LETVERVTFAPQRMDVGDTGIGMEEFRGNERVLAWLRIAWGYEIGLRSPRRSLSATQHKRRWPQTPISSGS
jgi:hypothetical protein